MKTVLLHEDKHHHKCVWFTSETLPMKHLRIFQNAKGLKIGLKRYKKFADSGARNPPLPCTGWKSPAVMCLSSFNLNTATTLTATNVSQTIFIDCNRAHPLKKHNSREHLSAFRPMRTLYSILTVSFATKRDARK
ncbi:hypothetical protein ACOMHN_066989 [Nucella lapillus]